MLKSALRGQDPVVFLEHKLLYGTKGPVPEGADHLVPLGRAAIVRDGRDLTVVATGLMVSRAQEAAARLDAQDISAEIVDPRTVSPIDWETIFASVDRTRRAIVVNEATLTCSVASEIAATLAEERFESLAAPVRRIGAPFVPKPSTPELEKLAYPTVEDIVRVAVEICPQPKARTRRSAPFRRSR
jgi:pyruvate dehydrogenase E1 component beta subunit